MSPFCQLSLRLCQGQLPGQILFQLAVDGLEAKVQLLVLLRQLHQGAGQQAGALQGIVHHLLEEGVQPASGLGCARQRRRRAPFSAT